MTTTTALRASAWLVLAALPLIQCGGEQKAAEAPTMPSAEPPSDQSPSPDAGTAQRAEGLEIATAPTKPEAHSAKDFEQAYQEGVAVRAARQ